MTSMITQGGVSGGGHGHAVPAGDQGEPQGDAAVVDKPLIQYAVEEAVRPA